MVNAFWLAHALTLPRALLAPLAAHESGQGVLPSRRGSEDARTHSPLRSMLYTTSRHAQGGDGPWGGGLWCGAQLERPTRRQLERLPDAVAVRQRSRRDTPGPRRQSLADVRLADGRRRE
eukprot:6640781-Prymnesium_polylepis.1